MSVGSGGICLQLAFFGAPDTGKASLIHQILDNGFVEEGAKENILVNCKNKTFAIPGMHNAVVMDTNDLHNFPPMKRVTIQRANIFVLVFAVNNEKSLDEVENYYHEIVEIKKGSTEYHNNRIPIVVVGNKSELSVNRRINSTVIQHKVVEEWDCKYIEVSARNGTNIRELKQTIIEEARLSYNAPKPRKKKQSIAYMFKSLISE
jgi:Ras family.